ncbi:hypothetical protein HW555_003931 [Spodoptera exigua]|uniref:Uncharacterized protein n=1 Tax=Spodoptera exigua TaxID=7107 RepID=A0A835GPB4_SPOEX|nr:hypothetical protein HW555_003931 [Spodoptera exigua]
MYTTGKLPEQINDTDGYHRNCYNSFTALMAKYRNLSEINFSSAVDLPSTSSSASTSNTEVSVQTTLSDETSENSHTEVNVQDIDTSNTTILPDSLTRHACETANCAIQLLIMESYPSTSKKRFTGFNDKWITDPHFKEWIEKKNEFTAICKACNSDIAIQYEGRRALAAHANSIKHKKMVMARKTSKCLDAFFIKKHASEEISIINSEVALIYHNVKHDSQIAAKLTCGRTKASAITRNVLGPYSQEKVISELKECYYFSVASDASNVGRDNCHKVLWDFISEGCSTDFMNNDDEECKKEGQVHIFLQRALKYIEERYDFSTDGIYKKFELLSLKPQELKLTWEVLSELPMILNIEDAINIDSLYSEFACLKTSKKSDDNFEKKFRNFDPSSLPPSTMRTDERNHYGQPGSPYDIQGSDRDGISKNWPT